MDTPVRYSVRRNTRPHHGAARWQVRQHRGPDGNPPVVLIGSYLTHSIAHGVACKIADGERYLAGYIR